MAQILEENNSNELVTSANHDNINFMLGNDDKIKEKVHIQIAIDEVSEMLSASTVGGTSRQRHYKASPLHTRSREETQEERRRRALEDQKKRRRDLTAHARNLALFKPTVILSDDESETEEYPSEVHAESSKLIQSTKRRLELEEDDAVQNSLFKRARLRPAKTFRRKRRARNPYR
ncbi:14083_t:CDS:2 [Acaulospora colombiana]|uniref:14083_t:CDS:1 n=1 Tax=Acaulospora colombiana TaxID=27376 RepID=A0ACA9LR69_9GLOM|nr:14083_t:CDS:2 [Acaulospora colombiana]